ncbi:hypothetical protein SteCoe_12872 [Stentor coeruleus]|uniref:Uncharacterized protein n=1 Tax=Stentor coeruleus TaxID=5963 RepID=A0A1R2C9R0_9CILI|nr:hypothetical protein SteCoe_12872 [Stentor coeruleus]
MRNYHKSKDSIKVLWTKLESVLDVSGFKSYGKILPKHKRHLSYNIRKSTSRAFARSTNDSPELSTVRSTTPSLSCTRNSLQIDGLSQLQLKKLYQAKCEDLNIPVLPDQQFRFYVYCFKHFYQRSFEMQDSGLGEKSAKAIGEILSYNDNFAYIVLGKNMFGDEGCLSIAKGLKKNLTIVYIDLSSNSLSPEGSEKIMKVLSSHESLAGLNISSYEGLHRNRLCSNGSNGLKCLLTKSMTISYINIARTSIGEGLKIIIDPLKTSMSLTSLDLCDNNIGNLYLEGFLRSLELSCVIDLNISSNCICNKGAEYVGDYLSKNPLLEKLNVANNGIKTKGAKKIFESLSNNSHLKILLMQGNCMNNGLSEEMAGSLAVNMALEELDLSGCMIKNCGIVMVAECLTRNRKIRILRLSGNGIGDGCLEELSISFTNNKTIKLIDLSCNKIKDYGAKFLAQGLKGSISIEEINLKENSIKDEGGNHLANAIKLNPNIIRINLDLNKITSKCLAGIKENLNTNIEKYYKTLPQKLKKQYEAINYDENSIKKISQKITQKKKEKEEIKLRIEKNVEKIEEIKSSEAQKLLILKENLEKLKENNIELSKSLENIQGVLMKFKIQNDRDVKDLEVKNLMIDEEIKGLEKKSTFYIEMQLKEKVLVQRGMKQSYKTQLDEEYRKEEILRISADNTLEVLKKRLFDIKELIRKIKNPDGVKVEENKRDSNRMGFLMSEVNAKKNTYSVNIPDFRKEKRLKTKSN